VPQPDAGGVTLPLGDAVPQGEGAGLPDRGPLTVLEAEKEGDAVTQSDAEKVRVPLADIVLQPLALLEAVAVTVALPHDDWVPECDREGLTEKDAVAVPGSVALGSPVAVGAPFVREASTVAVGGVETEAHEALALAVGLAEAEAHEALALVVELAEAEAHEALALVE
jgi:hypothetical protein